MQSLNFDKLRSEIANPYWKNNLSPLWLKFAGAHTPHRHRSNFLSVYSMFLTEAPTFGDGVKLMNDGELAHLCGKHSLPQKTTLISMVARIRACPSIETRYVGFKDYLHWLCPQVWELKPLGWNRADAKDQVLAYPYIRGTPRDEHVMLMEIHKLLPPGLEAEFKGEICQDIFVALLSGEVTMENLPDHIAKYKKLARRKMPEYGTVSLDEEFAPGFTRGEWVQRKRAKEINNSCCQAFIPQGGRGNG